MCSLRSTLIWLKHLVRGLFGRRRFVGLTPPFVRKQRIYDKEKRIWFELAIRDADDWVQVEHIFLNEEFDLSGTGRSIQIDKLYNDIAAQKRTPLIVDLGANIGLASRYFSQTFPYASLVSVEPNAGNCEVARRNLPAQAILVQGAVPSHNGRAALIDTGRNCGFRVDSGVDGSIELFTVEDLLARAGEVEPFIIKIDIEGFEEDLFSADVGWIDRFPVLLIELHDWMLPRRRVSTNFLAAMATRDRDFTHFDGYCVSLSDRV